MGKVDFDKFLIDYVNSGFSKKQMSVNYLLEEQGLQIVKDKIVPIKDKKEPKFKVGDWVVCVAAPKYTVFKAGGVVQITAENIHSFSMLESCFEKWDMKYANDGDVLYEKETKVVFLFKAVACGWVETYCDFWIYQSRFEQGERQYGKISEMDVCPATAEQREILFTAMREAGYTWNAEELKLEKIEEPKEELTEFEKGYQKAIDDTCKHMECRFCCSNEYIECYRNEMERNIKTK